MTKKCFHCQDFLIDVLFLISANWTVNLRPDIFEPLRESLWHYGQEQGLVSKVLNHLHHQQSDAPLSEDDLNPMKQIVNNWMLTHGKTHCWSIAPGQRFQLDVLQQLAQLVNDPDVDLHHLLQNGVPTAVLEPIPPGHIWPSKPSRNLLQSFDCTGQEQMKIQISPGLYFKLNLMKDGLRKYQGGW